MTFQTNFKAILFETRGFSVKLAPKMHPVCPPERSENQKIGWIRKGPMICVRSVDSVRMTVLTNFRTI